MYYRKILLQSFVVAVGLYLSSCGNTDSDFTRGPAYSVEIGMMCVQGPSDHYDFSSTLTADAPVIFKLYPKGCYSSSCTIVYDASCSVTRESILKVKGNFSLGNLSGMNSCTADCNGGGVAMCSAGLLTPGDYTAIAGDLELFFTIPSKGPRQCVGSPFLFE